MKKSPHGNDTIFVPEDQEEHDLIAALVRKHIPERYNTLAAEPLLHTDGGIPEQTWPEFVAFGLMMTRARMVGIYGTPRGTPDEPVVFGLMGLYFRAYVTTDPERRIDIKLFVEDNDEKHLEAICEFVSKHGPERAHAWTPDEAVNMPCPFMFYVAEALDEDPKKRMDWLVI